MGLETGQNAEERRGEGWLQGSSLWKWKRADYTDTNRDVGRKNEFLGKTLTVIGFFLVVVLYHDLGIGQKTGWYLVHPWIIVLILNSPSFSLIFSYLNALITTVEVRNLGEFWNERWNEIHRVCSWLGTHSSFFILLFLENIQNRLD